MRIKKATLILFVIIILQGLILNSFASVITEKDLGSVIPKANIFIPQEEPFNHYLAYNTDGGRFMGVAFLTTEVVPQETWGYRDQTVTLVGVDSNGKITGLKILEENETPQYVRGLFNDGSWFLDQFIGKDTSDEFLLGKDVDAITGATISSSAISRAIEAGLEIVTEKVLYKEIEKDSPTKHLLLHHLLWQIDFVFLWIIVTIAFIAFFKRSRPLRYLVLGLSIVYIGFVKGGGLSMTDILNIGYLNLPVFLNNLYWYSLVIIAIGVTLFAGRFYCGWICPFGAVLEILSHLTTVKAEISEKQHSYLKFLKYVILVAILMIAFLLSNKDGAIYIVSVFEPFATFFRLYGGVFTWVWIILMITLSIFMTRFFCRYLCPLGALFALISWLCTFFKIRQLNVCLPQKDCTGCKLAQKTCQMRAISFPDDLIGPEIAPEECFMCNTCAEICPVESKKNEKT